MPPRERSWRVEYTSAARRELKRLDPLIARRILDTVDGIAASGEPRRTGRALSGAFKHHWRYRVGKWRVIAAIDDQDLLLVVTKIAPRGSVYRS